MKDLVVVVIGGGASGMLAAGVAANGGAKVILLEKNEKLGKKIYITGKGRCNVCNTDVGEEFLKNVVTNAKFLYSSINNFNYYNVSDFFEKQNILLKVERGGRVFPVSDKASDIIKGLTGYLNKNKVDIKLNEKVKNIEKNAEAFKIYTDKGLYLADKVIIATGGLSYSSTGSSGDGYKFAADFGLKIETTLPALVPIKLNENVKNLEGTSLKNVTLTAIINNTFIKTEVGEMLFTSDGISGPLVLTLSSKINKLNYKNCIIEIDLKPALSETELDKRILKDFEKYNNKEFKNSLNDLLPQKLIPVVIEKSKIESDKKVNLISKEERKNLLNVLKHFSFSVKALYNVEAAVVTSGGVSVTELSPKTMESKKVKGLFFAGEVIDVDALTGGYNLQIAFSTGYAAGIGVLN